MTSHFFQGLPIVMKSLFRRPVIYVKLALSHLQSNLRAKYDPSHHIMKDRLNS
jgi:hypothetical protein